MRATGPGEAAARSSVATGSAAPEAADSCAPSIMTEEGAAAPTARRGFFAADWTMLAVELADHAKPEQRT